MLTFPSQQQLVRQSLWGDRQRLLISATQAEQLGLCDPNQMLFSNPACKVHCAASTCIPRAAYPALLPLGTEHCQPLCPVTSSVSWTSPLTSEQVQDHFCPSTREPALSLSERMHLPAGKIELLPNYTSAAHALAFPLTQVFLIASRSPLNWNLLAVVAVGRRGTTNVVKPISFADVTCSCLDLWGWLSSKQACTNVNWTQGCLWRLKS